MRAIIYEGGKRKWATDDGEWLLALCVGDEIRHPDESRQRPGGMPPLVITRVLSRSVDLTIPLIELHVEELIYGGPGCNV